MAEELIIEKAANEIVEEVAKSTSTFGGKVLLVVGGFCIGAGAGYYFTNRILRTKYQDLAETEIAEMRKYYLAKDLEREEKKPELDEVMSDRGYKTKLEGPDNIMYVKIKPGVPEVDPDIWDYAAEEARRSEDVPYVIHRDEFFNNETPFEQVQLTYYEGDDVLADSHDTPVDDQDAYVGLGNLSKFGHGSADPNVVYVRNHELGLEFEIVHDDGKFAQKVHGFSDDELQHGHKRQRRQRRYDDDSS